MSLEGGRKLAHYEIVEPIGKGGMGEVFRARDTRLGRDVAIKILPEAFSKHPDRLARFEREARLLASLNHPNIATLHGLEEHDGERFLVMELVEGRTLGELGRLSLTEALLIFEQLAEGLAAAHDRGILHRDLKPANVQVTPADRVKILDFGLAKALDEDTEPLGEASHSPTRTRDTALGAVLGTAPYMSPEQARGKPVDKRTDVWAYGCCFYESLTGRRAFDGETVTDIVAAIAKSEPDWSGVPARVRPLLERCLTKEVSKRLRDVGDAHLLLHPVERRETTLRSSRLPWAVAAAGILVALLAFLLPRLTPTLVPEPVRLSLILPEGQNLDVGDPNEPGPLAISPDGRNIAYVGVEGGIQKLFTRSVGEDRSVALESTDGAFGPFFSPDGEWIGFFAEESLRKVRLSRGPVTTLCPAPGIARGASWSADGNIVFSPGRRSPLFIVSGEGGEPRALTALNPETDELGHHFPQAVDGGVLYYVDGASRESLAFYDTESETSRIVLDRGARFGRYLASGHLMYADRAGTVYASAWTPDSVRAPTAGVRVMSNVNRVVAWGGFSVDVSQTGTLVYGRGVAGELVWVERSGRIERVGDGLTGMYPRISPDGSKLSTGAGGPTVHDIARGTTNRLAESGIAATWHPEDGTLAVMLTSGSHESIGLTRGDGSGKTTPVAPSDRRRWPYAFSPDGRRLLFGELGDGTGQDIWTTTPDGGEEPFLATPFNEADAAFSPDGRYVVFRSDKSGQSEIYVRDFPNGSREWAVSNDGGAEPRWPRDGEIVYRSGARMMAVDAPLTPEFRPGRPAVLFEGLFVSAPGSDVWASFDVTADSERFVMIREDPVARRQIHVVWNWTSELERLVPAND